MQAQTDGDALWRSGRRRVTSSPMADDRSAPGRKSDTHLNYVVIEGCIGVGKTTLTHLVADRLDARTVVEVVEENPFLPDFYKDQAAHAFKTQMFFLLSRFKQQESIVQTDLFQKVVVADYMFAKDRIFAELTLTGSELALYDQVYRALLQNVRTPDLVIHLRAPMDVIMQRIQRRGRAFERDIDPDYLTNLVEAYGRFFDRYTTSPLLTVDTSELNFPANAQDVDLLMETAEEVVTSGRSRHLTGVHQRQPRLV